jgi:hypothetical protein
MSPRRLECRGPGDRPCPAHAWWYSAPRGRPREFCAVCYPLHLALVRVCETCGYLRGDIKHNCARRLARMRRAMAAIAAGSSRAASGGGEAA